jgi:methylmalonyl-CoA mutase cobalamin-binding domain/chain
MSDILKKLEEAIYEGEDEIIEELAQKALDEGITPADIIQISGITAMDRLGSDFNDLIVFLPQLMIAGDTMKALISMLNPYMGEKSAFKGKVVIGCAKGDLHDIGKSLVATQLSVNGFEVMDIGVDVNNNKFVERAAAVGADIIAVSSLLTTSQYYMEDLVKRLESDGLRDKYRVIVGGGPISGEYAKKIGADGYSRTAKGAVALCEKLMTMKPRQELVVINE